MVEEIDVEELRALLDRDEPLRIVDIRDERAFDRGHIPTSESIPFPQLTTRIAELDGADRVVTVCPHGIASRQAAELIGTYEGTADARVESLHGGIEAWEREIGRLEATESEDGDPGRPDGPESNGSTDPDEGPEAPF